MPYTITEKTERRPVKMVELMLTVVAPYAAGHVLQANEAHALNGLLGENIRNNVAKEIVKQALVTDADGFALSPPQFKDGWNISRVQSEIVDAYTAEYEFGMRGRATIDPVERQAIQLCTQHIKSALLAAGQSADKERLATLVERNMDKHGDLFRDQARKLIEASKRQPKGLELDLSEPVEAEQQAA